MCTFFREILFNPDSVIEFANVEIDREIPSIRIRSSEKAVKSLSAYFTNTMLNTESCVRANYESISDAIKFGDTANSFTHIKSNFWKNDYSVTFQFRTYYPNGLLFVSVVSKISIFYH